MGGAWLAPAICPRSAAKLPHPFRVLGSAPEKPAGLLDRERLKTGKYRLLTLRPPSVREEDFSVSSVRSYS